MNLAISATTTFMPFKVNYRWLPTLFPEIDLNDTQFNRVKQFVEHAQQTVDTVHNLIIACCVIQIRMSATPGNLWIFTGLPMGRSVGNVTCDSGSSQGSSVMSPGQALASDR